eukprot:NODE_70_length_24940_cov_0.663138.p1 type:complete len:782 gc:universal NODE_70_length_24940_cov_0.663138:6421-8766(+)
MYALFLTLIAVSLDCSSLIQLAYNMNIKYTNPDYYIQYEMDCCLGNGVICENERVVELHWGFTSTYLDKTYKEATFPSQLRVLDLAGSTSFLKIKTLPNTLRVLDLGRSINTKWNITQFPELTYVGLNDFIKDKLPILPDTLEYINLQGYQFNILPFNATRLQYLYSFAGFVDPSPFPNIPESIKHLFLSYSNLYGPIPHKFPSIESLYVSNNALNGTLNITSPNITYLSLEKTYFDKLIFPNSTKLLTCSLSGLYLNKTSSVTNLPKICSYPEKQPQSIDCPKLIEFANQLNMHLTNPDYFNALKSLRNCCEDPLDYVICSGNRVTKITWDSMHLNGTINATLLPITITDLSFGGNNFQKTFPNLKSLFNLQTFQIGSSKLHGEIPKTYLPNLKELRMAYNQLNGTVPYVPGMNILFANHNYFTDHGLNGSTLSSIDLSYNLIKGVIDMSNFQFSYYCFFKFSRNLFTAIITRNSIDGKNILDCNVSANNLTLSSVQNFVNCRQDHQIYTDQTSCRYVTRLFKKMGITTPELEQNCCADQPRITCKGENVTNLFFYGDSLNTYYGKAFLLEDIPPTLQSLRFTDVVYNQSVLIPELPSTVTELVITNSNFVGGIPNLPTDLNYLYFENLNLNGTLNTSLNALEVIIVVSCNLSGTIASLPPNLHLLDVSNNSFSGNLPKMPSSLKYLTLGIKSDERNTFLGSLVLQKPLSIILGNVNISEIFINDTSQLYSCDLSFNPLENSTNIANYSVCSKYYLAQYKKSYILLDNSLIVATKSGKYY